MRTKQEILNRIDSLNEEYHGINEALECVSYSPLEQKLTIELDFIEAELDTLNWMLNLS